MAGRSSRHACLADGRESPPPGPSLLDRTRSDQTDCVGEHYRLRPVAQLELVEDMRDVGLHRRFGEEQTFGDLAVGQPAGDQLEDLGFALGELRQPGVTGVVDRGVRPRRSGRDDGP